MMNQGGWMSARMGVGRYRLAKWGIRLHLRPISGALMFFSSPPELPREMERLDMRIRYRGHSLDLRLTRDSLTVRGHNAAKPPIFLCVDGKVSEFVSGTTRVFQLNNGD